MTTDNTGSYHACGEPSYFFKLTSDIKKNELAFCATKDPLLHFSFPLELLSDEKIVKLKHQVVLTEEMIILRRNMLREVPVSEHFIHSILALHILTDEVDYSDDTIKTLIKSNNMHLRQFVQTPGKDNLFFVMGFSLDDLTLSCIEVHPSKPIAYKRVKINVKQVSLAKWQGDTFPIEDYAAFFAAEEKTFLSRIREVETCSKPRDEYNEY